MVNITIVDQNFCCAICGKHEKDCSKQKLYVDHDHDTKQVRGLLCSRCNSAIGLFDESVEKLSNAVRFLNKNKKLG